MVNAIQGWKLKSYYCSVLRNLSESQYNSILLIMSILNLIQIAIQMKNIFLLMVFSLLLVAAGCSYDNERTTVTQQAQNTQATYNISFPAYMTPETEGKLSQTAGLQYCNYFRNIYAIVNDTNKTDLQNYAQAKAATLVAALKNPRKIDSTQTNINGLPAISVAYTGDVGPDEELMERIYYRIAFIQGQQTNYELTIWCWDKWREKYLAEMDTIVQSFKEL